MLRLPFDGPIVTRLANAPQFPLLLLLPTSVKVYGVLPHNMDDTGQFERCLNIKMGSQHEAKVSWKTNVTATVLF